MKLQAKGGESAIVLKNVSVDLGRHRVLNNLSASIERGERLLISGENGAGKTTLLKTVLGLITPVLGDVRVLGTAVGSREWRSRRRRVGYLNQEFAATDLSITAYEVAEIGASEVPVARRQRRDIVADAMNAMGCLSLRDRPYTELSGGEKRKVDLARCLSQRAEVLLLDEPTSFLHPEAKDEILSILRKLSVRDGITLLMVSHEHGGMGLQDWRRGELFEGRLLGSEATERPLSS
jgi:ABC-type multidrug transport system ATPase subunit